MNAIITTTQNSLTQTDLSQAMAGFLRLNVADGGVMGHSSNETTKVYAKIVAIKL
jgi:hypothetical protein